ncbi:ABC transporter permease [Lactonifactor longoviformis]|uniref:ABC-type transport system, involved in lipoprotein release, permease component n=1 Tax=Lactonifactor longoviformis DSM 17459 TaxID=1122155 RepID=A0A1M4ZG27_9CLOT|nr:ABC transporter permease [Lactonifactor longoviformis]POP34560.1 ABC transporter permease [Lactonifactor longoviformis]SHF17003.1 ABC-type transport system, involved in lipoprotein release, permease component [Lactonifactor longoviformis DSM 17459]
MRSYTSLVWRELKVQKVTSFLILAAVILSSLMTAVICQSIGILTAMRLHQASVLNGDRHVTFHQITREEKERLFADRRLEFAASWQSLGTASLGNSGLRLQLREYLEEDLSIYPQIKRVKKGRLPEKPLEIALPEDALQLLGFSGEIGDTISLRLSITLLHDDQLPWEYTQDFLLTGILENNYLGYTSGAVSGIAGERTAERVLPEKYQLFAADLRLRSLDDFQEQIESLGESIHMSEDEIQYNWIYLNALGVPYGEETEEAQGFPFLMLSAIMVGVLVLLASGLVIYNILKITVTRRMSQYGVLRAIGTERIQLYWLITLEILIFCAVGIPLGTAGGIAASGEILESVLTILSPEAFQTGSPEELLSLVRQSGDNSLWAVSGSILITLASSLLASLPAASYAARVSPVTAIGHTSAKAGRRRRRRKKIKHFEAFYGRLNLRRNPARTFITVLSLAMSIAVFVALQSFTRLLDTSREVRDMHPGDYSVTNKATGFTPHEASNLAADPAVASFRATKFSCFQQDDNGELPLDVNLSLQPGETFQITGIDTGRIWKLAGELSEEKKTQIQEGTACVVKNPIPVSFQGRELARTQIQKGDTIEVEGHKLDVAAVTDGCVTVNNDGFQNGVQVIVTDKLYDRLTGSSQYTELYPVLTSRADEAAFEERLKAFCGQIPGSTWLSYRNTDRQLEESFQQIRLLSWGFIIFIGLIGILNIINTVYTNIHTRITEIGIQRAVGMSTGSLYKTFLWEGVYYSLWAAGTGSAAGLLCTYVIYRAAGGSFSLRELPLSAVAAASVFAAFVCLTATAIPLRQAAKRSIVEAIGTGE